MTAASMVGQSQQQGTRKVQHIYTTVDALEPFGCAIPTPSLPHVLGFSLLALVSTSSPSFPPLHDMLHIPTLAYIFLALAFSQSTSMCSTKVDRVHSVLNNRF